MSLTMQTALLAIQQSLLGEISAGLRAVTIRFLDEDLHFDAYYDGVIQEEDMESMSCVETELIAALPENIRVVHSVHRVDFPSLLPKTDIFVYMRREHAS